MSQRPTTITPAWIALAVILYLGAAGTATFLAVKVHPGMGLLGLIIVLTTAPITAALLSRRGHTSDQSSDSTAESPANIESLSTQVSALVQQLSLPEDARRVTDRHFARDVLRRAIEEEIAAGQYEAAIALIERLGVDHGLLQEAEAYRRRIEDVRSPARDADLQVEIQQLDELIGARRWDVAFADAGRILRLYPESPKAQRLQERVEHARSAHKNELLRAFEAATQESRLDDAMTTLKQLDEFLTEVEAEPLRETARSIIARTRDSLGAEFRHAVQERRWADAADLGTRIVEEFPNTRMAAEVREVLDGIRERAGTPGTTL